MSFKVVESVDQQVGLKRREILWSHWTECQGSEVMIQPEDTEKVAVVICGWIHDAIVPWAASRQDFNLQLYSHLCDQWAWAVVTGPVTDRPWWESRLKARLCDCSARPRMTQVQGDREHYGPWPWGPPAPPLPRSTSCLCHSTSKSNPWSKAKEKKGKRRERRQRSEKGEGDWRACWEAKGESNKPLFIWLGGQLLGPEHLCACRLPGWSQAPPKCLRVPDPWKVAMATPLGPQSEINNLSTSTE